MELTQLRYIVAIAKHGNITRAARALNTHQPTVSVAIKQLEEELGTPLLYRSGRGVTMTMAGRRVLDMALEVSDLIQRTRSELVEFESELVGQFSLGCNEALGTYFLPNFMSRFLAEAPRIELSIWNASSPEVRDAVVNRTIDYGLVVNPEPHADLVIRKLFRDGIQVFISTQEGSEPSLEAAKARLKKGPLIATRRIRPVRQILNYLKAEGDLPPRVIDCGDLHLVRSLAAAGIGVALLPRRIAFIRPNELNLLHPQLPGYPDVIGLVYRSDTHRTQAAIKLKNVLLESGKEMQRFDPPEGTIALVS